jgi:hypothetical protein
VEDPLGDPGRGLAVRLERFTVLFDLRLGQGLGERGKGGEPDPYFRGQLKHVLEGVPVLEGTQGAFPNPRGRGVVGDGARLQQQDQNSPHRDLLP